MNTNDIDSIVDGRRLKSSTIDIIMSLHQTSERVANWKPSLRTHHNYRRQHCMTGTQHCTLHEPRVYFSISSSEKVARLQFFFALLHHFQSATLHRRRLPLLRTFCHPAADCAESTLHLKLNIDLTPSMLFHHPSGSFFHFSFRSCESNRKIAFTIEESWNCSAPRSASLALNSSSAYKLKLTFCSMIHSICMHCSFSIFHSQ